MVQGWMNKKLQDHGQWSFVFLFVVSVALSTTLNIALAPKTHAIDILQPVTSILNSLLGPDKPAAQPSTRTNPTPASPPPNTPASAPSTQTSPASSAPPTGQGSSAPTNSENPGGTDFAPLTTELEPVVLGTAVSEVTEHDIVATPPTQLVGSVSQADKTQGEPEKCGKLFGACWYWWTPALPLLGLIGFMGFRSRFVAPKR